MPETALGAKVLPFSSQAHRMRKPMEIGSL